MREIKERALQPYSYEEEEVAQTTVEGAVSISQPKRTGMSTNLVKCEFLPPMEHVTLILLLKPLSNNSNSGV